MHSNVAYRLQRLQSMKKIYLDVGLKNKKKKKIEKDQYKTNLNILEKQIEKRILWINEDKGYSMNIKLV